MMFSLICVWINGWVNNREAGDLRRHRGHYDVNIVWPNKQLWKKLWQLRKYIAREPFSNEQQRRLHMNIQIYVELKVNEENM